MPKGNKKAHSKIGNKGGTGRPPKISAALGVDVVAIQHESERITGWLRRKYRVQSVSHTLGVQNSPTPEAAEI